MALMDDIVSGKGGALGQTNAGDDKGAKWLHDSPVGLAVWAVTPITLHEVSQFGIADVDRCIGGLTKDVDVMGLFRKAKGDEFIKKLGEGQAR